MKQRVISAIVALLIVIPLYLLGGIPFKSAIGILAALAYIETLGLKESHRPYPNYIQAIGLICLELVLYANPISDTINFFTAIGLTLLVLTIPSIFDTKEKYTTKEAFYLTGTICLIGTFFNGLSTVYFLDEHGLILLYLILIATMTDTFAYLIGSLIGKHKLIPKVSPKKSIEGSIAGTLMGTTISTIYYINIVSNNINIIVLIIMGIILSILGQLGDLFFSKMKRENDIKDFSNIMPGHGGILDRLDSLSFIMFGYIIITSIINLF